MVYATLSLSFLGASDDYLVVVDAVGARRCRRCVVGAVGACIVFVNDVFDVNDNVLDVIYVSNTTFQPFQHLKKMFRRERVDSEMVGRFAWDGYGCGP